ncbi:NUDIX domain-containing protein [Allorhizobium terrae]|uniref:GDP-mannose pyrophosphatase n=1 Tax=Allorhizobium terrae TaxID=1848972 RepID=A0A4S4A2E6_9HYPH|nr:NUDIX domain-containing protein [Allorhizobium terrae]THF52410.1 NUDIX domain-containing protein [Allorhizobium terrae]
MSKFDKTVVKLIEDKPLWKGWSHLHGLEYDYTDSSGKRSTFKREVLERKPAVAVLLYDRQKKTTVLVRQFRAPAHLMGDAPFLLEAPAGLIDSGEAEDTACREVLEETGYTITSPRFLFAAYMSPGAVSEKIHFFVAEISDAQKLADGGGLEDEHEDLEVLELPLGSALAMIATGEIVDAKTIMLLQWAALNGMAD